MKYSVELDINKDSEHKVLKALVCIQETKEDLRDLMNKLYSYSSLAKELKEDAQMHNMSQSDLVDYVLEQVRKEVEIVVTSAYLD
jgi:DNA-binding transcriptional regulator YbjK